MKILASSFNLRADAQAGHPKRFSIRIRKLLSQVMIPEALDYPQ